MDKLQKYDGNTSDQVLTYLKRNFKTYELGSNEFDWMVKPIKFVVVNEKSYLLDRNKKMLVNRIFLELQDVFSNTEVPILRRTIKKYLDGVSDEEKKENGSESFSQNVP